MIKDCCQQPENLSERVSEDERPGLIVRRCAVCGCRHFELTVDPAVLGIEVKEM